MNAEITGTETFTVEDGHMVRRAVPRRGRPYEHRCPKDAFEQVTHAAEELGDSEAGFSISTLVQYERTAGRDVTFTNVAVTLAFLRERGILETRHRMNYAATSCVHLEAMTEYHAPAAQG